MDNYCLDTSVLIQGWNALCPPDVFPSVWKHLDDLGMFARIRSPDEVLRELRRQEDELSKWATERKHLFCPVTDELWIATQEVMNVPEFARIQERGHNGADPWVIGLARLDGLTVVTEEIRHGKKIRIPAICEHFGIRCLRLMDLLRETGFKL